MDVLEGVVDEDERAPARHRARPRRDGRTPRRASRHRPRRSRSSGPAARRTPSGRACTTSAGRPGWWPGEHSNPAARSSRTSSRGDSSGVDGAPHLTDPLDVLGEVPLGQRRGEALGHRDVTPERLVHLREQHVEQRQRLLGADHLTQQVEPARRHLLQHAVGVPEDRRDGRGTGPARGMVSRCRARGRSRGSAPTARAGTRSGPAAARRPGCRRAASRRPGW